MSVRELIPGWPALRAMRWSEEQASSFYRSGLWGPLGLDGLLASHARTRPDRLACTDGCVSLTHAELDQRAQQVAGQLLGCGLAPGDIVLVALGNNVEHVLAVYALAAAGLVAYELPVETTPRALSTAARRTWAAALITDRPVLETAAQALSSPALMVLDLADLEAAEPAAVAAPGQNPDTVCTLIGTSGTTGTPKIVMRSANCSLAMARGVIAHSGLEADDVLLVAAPLQGGVGFINGIGSVALTGCSLVIPTDLAPETLLRLISEHGVTRIATLPTVATRMLSSPAFRPADVETVEVLQTGGAFLAPEMARALERAFGCRMIVVYGAIDVGAPTMVSIEDPAERRHTTLGRVVDGAELAIVGPDGEHLSVGEVGEVAMRGPDVALGYFADEQATASVFDSAGWGRLGDLGAVDADGYLRLVGRVKEIINRGGKKISIAEVEAAVSAVAGVRDVAAVGYPDADLGERCGVFVVTESTTGFDLDALRERLTRLDVPKALWPERIECVRSLPVSASGKVNRDELRQRLARR